jgi:hypothetical protein
MEKKVLGSVWFSYKQVSLLYLILYIGLDYTVELLFE